MLLAVLAGYYVVWSATNWITLDAAALRFDFVNYFGGAQAAAHGTDLYAEFKRSWGTQSWVTSYIYPPFFALLLAPTTALGLVTAGRVWLLVIQVTFLAALWLILRVNPELPATGRRLFLAGAFAFMPVYLNVKFQQVAGLWLLLLAAAIWAALRRRDRWSGLFIALAASLKVVPIFLIPLFARLGRWGVALYASLFLAMVTAATMLATPGSWEFFTLVLPRIGLGNSNWDNGSVTGLISRFDEFFPGALGPDSGAVARFLLAIAVTAVIGFTLWKSSLTGNNGWGLRLSVAALITGLLMVSSVTWQHHLVILLLPFAVAMAWIYARRASAVYAAWLAASYVLCWMDRRAFPLPSDLKVHSTWEAVLVLLGTSVKLAGLVILWTLLLDMLRREKAAGLRRPAAERDPSISSAA
jgi:alpha-1,2-mannosyltransferase